MPKSLDRGKQLPECQRTGSTPCSSPCKEGKREKKKRRGERKEMAKRRKRAGGSVTRYEALSDEKKS